MCEEILEALRKTDLNQDSRVANFRIQKGRSNLKTQPKQFKP